MTDTTIPPGARCPRHAMIMATHVCEGCGKAVCDRCLLQLDGKTRCRCCTADAVFTPPPPTGLAAEPRLGTPPSFMAPPQPYAHFKCANHAENEATVRCSGCGAHVCKVCDFPVGGRRHACPACVLREPDGIPSNRRNLAIIGCFIAAWATLGMGLLLTGYFASMTETPADLATLDLAFHFLVFVPNLGGFAFSMSAIERNQPNTSFLWMAVIWNAILALGYVTLTIIGNFFM